MYDEMTGEHVQMYSGSLSSSKKTLFAMKYEDIAGGTESIESL